MFEGYFKQLHISTASVTFSNAHFGAGAGPIYLANVGCSGSEGNLTDCSHNFTVSCYSGHSEDAGVRCQGRFHRIVTHAMYRRCM